MIVGVDDRISIPKTIVIGIYRKVDGLYTFKSKGCEFLSYTGRSRQHQENLDETAVVLVLKLRYIQKREVIFFTVLLSSETGLVAMIDSARAKGSLIF